MLPADLGQSVLQIFRPGIPLPYHTTLGELSPLFRRRFKFEQVTQATN